MSDNLKIWNAVKAPPASAMKEIKGGRLNGYTDISPQWRLQVLTEQFGPAGFGWTYETVDKWTKDGPNGQISAHVDILLYVCIGGEWSRGIPGTGGSMLVAQEKTGLHFSDEAYKMATTDAISVAAKCLGIGSDVYMGQLSHKDSKYHAEKPSESPPVQRATTQARDDVNKRIQTALKAIFGNNKEAALDRIEQMTTFTKDGKTIKGKRDYTAISDKQANIVVGRLEDEVEDLVEDQICNECRMPMSGGVCETISCPNAQPDDILF